MFPASKRTHPKGAKLPFDGRVVIAAVEARSRRGVRGFDDLPDEPIEMVMAGKQTSDAVMRRFACVRLGMVCVEGELAVHVVEVQPLTQMLPLEQLWIRPVQPTGNFRECGLVEPLCLGRGRKLSRLRAPAQDGIELDIRWLSQRFREVDNPGDASLVDDHVGSMEVTMDDGVFVDGEQCQPLLDPIGNIGEQTRVMTGHAPLSLDLLKRRTDYRRVERSPRLAGERVGQPGRQQIGRDRNAVKGAQRNAEALDDCLARVRVRRWPCLV
jgi:hypothetical protein